MRNGKTSAPGADPADGNGVRPQLGCSTPSAHRQVIRNGGNTMIIKSQPLLWKSPRFEGAFACFVRGCENEAGHLTRLTHGEAIVQVCLCSDCVGRSPESIIDGITVNPAGDLN